MVKAFFDQNDHTIRVKDLKRTDDDTFVTDATVEVTIVDAAGVAVVGSWPVTLVYEPTTSGTYSVVVDKAAVQDLGDFQEAHITAVKDSIDAFWQVPLQVVRRQE